MPATGRIPTAGKLKLGTANIRVCACYRNLFARAVSQLGDGHVDHQRHICFFGRG